MLDYKARNTSLLFIWDPKSGAYSSHEMKFGDKSAPFYTLLANTYNSEISVFNEFRRGSIKVLHPLDYSVVGEIPPPRRYCSQI